MTNAVIAQNIKHLCKTNAISVAALLHACNISKSLIYDLEKRDKTPSADKLLSIANYLDCSVDYLLGRTTDIQSHLGAAVAADDEAELLAAYRSCDNFGKCAVMETAQREAARTKAQLTKAK